MGVIRSARVVSIATCISLMGNVASTPQKVYRTENFNLPVQRRRDGRFKLPSGMQLYVGLSTDFFVEEADQWRDEAWRIMRQRPDIVFRRSPKEQPESRNVFRMIGARVMKAYKSELSDKGKDIVKHVAVE